MLSEILNIDPNPLCVFRNGCLGIAHLLIGGAVISTVEPAELACVIPQTIEEAALFFLDVLGLISEHCKRHLLVLATVAYVIHIAILVVKLRIEVLRYGRKDQLRVFDFLFKFRF